MSKEYREAYEAFQEATDRIIEQDMVERNGYAWVKQKIVLTPEYAAWKEAAHKESPKLFTSPTDGTETD